MRSPPQSFVVLAKIVATFLQLLAEMLQSHSFSQPDFDKVRDESLGRLRELEEETDWSG